MRRGDEDEFEPAHLVDQFGMHKYSPSLRSGVHEYDIQRSEAEESERDEVQEAVEGLEDGGTEAHRKVHFLGRMMRDVDGPEEPNFMIPPVEPVIKEVFSEQKQQPIGENVRDRDPVIAVAELKDQQVAAAKKEINEAVEEHQVNIAQGIFKGIEIAVPEIGKQDLQPDDDKI
jgi:hypothetical protein